MTSAAQTRETYHHGNLPQTLIHEAAGLLAEKGAEGFSMREVARRAFEEDVFSVVLTPAFDDHHKGHLHLDMAHYRAGEY